MPARNMVKRLKRIEEKRRKAIMFMSAIEKAEKLGKLRDLSGDDLKVFIICKLLADGEELHQKDHDFLKEYDQKLEDEDEAKCFLVEKLGDDATSAQKRWLRRHQKNGCTRRAA